jgi:hypothetical protein
MQSLTIGVAPDRHRNLWRDRFPTDAALHHQA